MESIYSDENILVTEGAILTEKWAVGPILGKGGVGMVYRARRVGDGYGVVLKVEEREELDGRRELSCNEHEVYKHLQMDNLSQGLGIPKIIEFVTTEREHILVMPRLGLNVEDIFSQRELRFSLKTALWVGFRVLSTLEYLHKKGYVHGDIKPENILVGSQGDENALYLIDYGEAWKFKYSDETLREQVGEEIPFYGTPMFAPIRAHKQEAQSQRDDLESLGYLLVYLHLGLPWEKYEKKSNPILEKKVGKKKGKMKKKKLCGKIRVLRKYFEHVEALEYGGVPDYEMLRLSFCEAAGESLDEVNDRQWVWKE